jgi:hypothetical protein
LKIKKIQRTKKLFLNFDQLHNFWEIACQTLLQVVVRRLVRNYLRALPTVKYANICFESMLVIENLIKEFGSFRAVNGLNLKIKENTIYGLLGFNGAGNLLKLFKKIKSDPLNVITYTKYKSFGW